MNFSRLANNSYLESQLPIDNDQYSAKEIYQAAKGENCTDIAASSDIADNEVAIAEALARAAKAEEAVRFVNTQIDYCSAADASHATQVRELISSAMQPGSTASALSLQKAAKAVTHERLAMLLRAAQIPELKKAAQSAIRDSAKARIPIYERYVSFFEAQADFAADVLGLAPVCVQRTQMIRTNPDRNRALQLLSSAQRDSANYRVNEDDSDTAAMDELKGKIKAMLT